MAPPRPRPRVLLVEDEYLVGDLARDMLSELGYEAIGPVPTVEKALSTIPKTHCHAAILDVVLQDRPAYPVAEALAARNIPFGFATGVDGATIDTRWRDRPFVAKPFLVDDMRRLLTEIVPDHDPPDG